MNRLQTQVGIQTGATPRRKITVNFNPSTPTARIFDTHLGEVIKMFENRGNVMMGFFISFFGSKEPEFKNSNGRI